MVKAGWFGSGPTESRNAMKNSDFSLYSRQQAQAQKAVSLSLAIAFLGGIIGVIFALYFGSVSAPESWAIIIVTCLTGGLLGLVSARPAMATNVVTGCLTIYFLCHLNAGSMIAFADTKEISRTLPYITWFFPLVVFHNFTNLGFHKRIIGWLVTVGPTPIAAFILMEISEPLAIGAVVSLLFSYFAFVAFINIFTAHRDQEILRAARAEEAARSADLLRVSEERFRLLSLATDDLVCDFDLKAGKVWWNEKLRDSYGYDPQAFADDLTACKNWVHCDDRERVSASLCAALDSGQTTWVCEFRIVCADERVVDVVVRSMILRDDQGQLSRVIGSTTDVSEMNALQKKLRQSQKMEAVGQLTGGLAHDFNNLLTIIIGNAEELIEMNAGHSNARSLAETTMKAAERGANLTSRLLSFARLQPLAPVNLDVAGLLTGIEALIRRTISENIAIAIKAPGDVWSVNVDPGQLENAILNLVINARDAMPEGGQLIIEASNLAISQHDRRRREGFRAERYVVIEVSDTGCGMSSEITERAFEPFFTTKDVGKGSGLGLSMVWGFVQQSHGQAEIYSGIGRGTSVKLYFPAAGRHSAPTIEAERSHGPVSGTEQILVVEDDDLVRENVVLQLGRLGYRIKAASSAAEALQILETGAAFDLLFTDVVMPGGMNGQQLAEAARQKHPALKVLYTSGYAEAGIIRRGGLEPDHNLLSKPYRRAQLAAAIRKVLDGGQ